MPQTLSNHYTVYAWAGGDKELQRGRWPHIELMLQKLEPDSPGLTAEVMDRLASLRKKTFTKVIDGNQKIPQPT